MTPSPGTLLAVRGRFTEHVVSRLSPPGDGDILVPQRRLSIIGTTQWTTEDLEDSRSRDEDLPFLTARAAELVPAFASAKVHAVWSAPRPPLRPGLGRRRLGPGAFSGFRLRASRSRRRGGLLQRPRREGDGAPRHGREDHGRGFGLSFAGCSLWDRGYAASVLAGLLPRRRGMTREIELRLPRTGPEGEIVWTSYRAAVTETTTLLEALEELRAKQVPDLLYRHSCHHGSCGTCACRGERRGKARLHDPARGPRDGGGDGRAPQVREGAQGSRGVSGQAFRRLARGRFLPPAERAGCWAGWRDGGGA